MLHKPVERKVPKKYNEGERSVSEEKKSNPMQVNRQAVYSKKQLTQKNINQTNVPKLPRVNASKTIPQKVERLQKAVQRMNVGTNQPQIQRLLLEQIKGIKSELRQIKQQIGLTSIPARESRTFKQQAQVQEIQEENIANLASRQEEEVRRIVPQPKEEIKNNSNMPNQFQAYHIIKKKELLQIGKIQPYLKEFKLQGSKIPQPFYRGYHKKSSKPIVIKYCSQGENMQPQIALYEKLWKNMVKAKKVCINKLYEINEPLANNIIALEMNKNQLKNIELSHQIILKDVLRGIQFMHECGYLYRDLHPQHVMQTFQGNVVLIGLKKMKKFMDIKGKLLEVRGSPDEGIHQFISNARLRSMSQSRKDDLQTVGYLALYLLEGRLPWNAVNMLQVRSKVTLQQLYGKYKGLFELMVTIHRMAPQQSPNYDALHSLIAF